MGKYYNDSVIPSEMDSLIVCKKPPLIRLWSHRIRRFLYSLIGHLGENAKLADHILHDIVRTTVKCVLEIANVKNKLHVYLYDISLACFWLKLQEYGITEVSLLKLIRIAKRILKHRITHGKILRILTHIRGRSEVKYVDPIEEIKRYSIMILERMFNDRAFILKKLPKDKREQCNIMDLKLKIIRAISESMAKIPSEVTIGIPKKVLSAVILYVTLRNLSDTQFIQVSSRDIERFSGVSRFTILRKYKKLEKYLTCSSL